MTAGQVAEAADFVRGKLGKRRPEVAVVLGSGMAPLAGRVGEAVRIPYREIPGFPSTTVVGHEGELVVGTLGGRMVLVQSGRFHLYEGHPASLAVLPVRVFGELGIGTLILTNAAGGIRRTFSRGALMLIADHINLTFRNPLFGPVFPGDERFPDMSEPYDRELRALAGEVARERRVHLEEGVYLQLLGPSYETPAEVRMAERLGADAVGMSTAIEVIAARARGMRCLAFSTITNPAAGITGERLNHAEVMEVAKRVAGDLERVVEGVVTGLTM
ncbi:MAG: purine-nucleoside phosphorylase, partial [Gemmatimonadales bacterium]|nr:purine-nucleoside phosphorylase [Gemmatimonadales bacterium]MBA3554027.1 purine-nucleoside phosphorylase [Gemmatimonadales bacterium]